MRLMVCGRTSVKDYLDAPVTHFVTLVDPGEKEPAQPPRSAKHRLQLIFSDLDDIEIHLPRFANYVAPEEKDISEMVAFGRKLADLEDFGLLANCEAGISRSTATAITILTASGYTPQQAFDIVQRVCPEMLPNRRILRIADKMLNTNGDLHRLAEKHRQEAFVRAGYEDPTIIRLREAQAEEKTLKGFLRRVFAWVRIGKALPDPRLAKIPSIIIDKAAVAALLAKDDTKMPVPAKS
jgi:predicted protein tyrosine phosphatase